VAVPDIQRFHMYAASYGHMDRARGLYASLSPSARADRCDGCGLCEQRCPHGLPIRAKLNHAHEALA
jgi:predicted aldo/keto reductase-like oxidoreductase